MRPFVFAIAIGLCGCAHRPPPAPSQPTIGESHRPYTGVPWYMELNRQERAAAPAVSVPPGEREPVVGGQIPKGERLDRLRALLAAADAEIVLIGPNQTEADQRALTLTVGEIVTLLKPYPDIAAEADELRELTAKLPATRAIELTQVKRRMGELTDLIRVQLLAGN
ncbi:MAG TPA: hypothetical protein VII38_08485 [Polyangia bacterium]|jgi:hypothetical protein